MDSHYTHVVMAALATMFIAYISLRLHRSYKEAGDPLVPDTRFSFRNLTEVAIQQLYSLIEGILGKGTPRYFPLLAAVFLYTFVNNLMGLIPGLSPATSNVNTNFAMSIVIFVYYNYEGIREHGLGYLKHFMGPVLWLAPLITIIEIVNHISRPVSLSLRLFGNINGDHMVLGIFSDFCSALFACGFPWIGALRLVPSGVYLYLAFEHLYQFVDLSRPLRYGPPNFLGKEESNYEKTLDCFRTHISRHDDLGLSCVCC